MWKYKDRIIRVGRSWVDDDGTKHPWNWLNWDYHRKLEVGIKYVGDVNNGSK